MTAKRWVFDNHLDQQLHRCSEGQRLNSVLKNHRKYHRYMIITASKNKKF